MKVKFIISPFRCLFLITCLVFLSSYVFAQTTDVTQSKTVIEFIGEYWAIIALTVSEIIPFLGQKTGGIVQAVFTILGGIFKKKL